MSMAQAQKLLDMIVASPTDQMARGAIRFLMSPELTYDPRTGASHVGPHLRELARRAFEAAEAAAGPRVKMERYSSPFTGPSLTEPRDLTVGEAVWLTNLSDDPSKLTARDAGALASLTKMVKTPAERAMVARVADPVRAHHEAQTRARNLEVEIALMRVGSDVTTAGPLGCSPEAWPQWRKVLAEEIRKEATDLTPEEAETRATVMARETFQRQGVEPSHVREQKRAELGDLCRTYGFKARYFPDAHKWGADGDPGFRPPVDPEAVAA